MTINHHAALDAAGRNFALVPHEIPSDPSGGDGGSRSTLPRASVLAVKRQDGLIARVFHHWAGYINRRNDVPPFGQHLSLLLLPSPGCLARPSLHVHFYLSHTKVAIPGAGHPRSSPSHYKKTPRSFFLVSMVQTVNVTLDDYSPVIEYSPAGAWLDGSTVDPFWNS